MAPRDPLSTWGNASPGYGPFSNAKAITPSDTADLEVIPSALHIGATGDLTVTMGNGEKVTFKNIAAGTGVVGLVGIRPVRIWATGTTVTGIVALW